MAIYRLSLIFDINNSTVDLHTGFSPIVLLMANRIDNPVAVFYSLGNKNRVVA